MKCAFIASFYGPYYSNFVAAMIAFDKKMKQEGHSVFYILPEETENFEWMPILKEQNDNIYFLEYKPYSFNNFFALKKIFRKEKVDLIYSHMCGWDLTARFAAPVTPIVWHMHMNVNITNKIKFIKNWIKFRIFGFGKTYHIAVSNPVAKAINSLNPKNKCTTIQNGIDFSRLQVKTQNTTKSKEKNILIFGWAPYVKGLDIALDACEKLSASGLSFKLLVSAQEKTYGYVASRYNELPEWLQMIEPTSDVASLYNKADIMLSASRSEGFSFALAEAIYNGCVTVVSDIEGTSWSNGFKARFEFHSEIAESLTTALTKAIHYTITQEESEFNKNILQTQYSIEVWADAVYNQIKTLFWREDFNV